MARIAVFDPFSGASGDMILGALVDAGVPLASFRDAISRLGIYIATCAALIALRRKHGEPTGFRAPGGIVLAVSGIVFCLWLLSTRSLAQAWFLPLVILLGFGVWGVMRAARASADRR